MDANILAYIVAPLITGVFAVIGQYIITNKKSKEQEIKDAVRDQKTDDRLERIEDKLDEHNGYAKRFEGIEKAIVKIETKINDNK